MRDADHGGLHVTRYPIPSLPNIMKVQENTEMGEYMCFIEYMYQREVKSSEYPGENSESSENSDRETDYFAAFICFGGERIGSRKRKRRETSFKTAEHASSAWVMTGPWPSRAPCLKNANLVVTRWDFCKKVAKDQS